eukprot:3727126-Pyramimonas_sp.AAC.2
MGDGDEEREAPHNDPETTESLSRKRKFDDSEEPKADDENPNPRSKAACRDVSDQAVYDESPDTHTHTDSTAVEEKPWTAVIGRHRAKRLGQGKGVRDPTAQGKGERNPTAQALHAELRGVFDAYNKVHHAIEEGEANSVATAEHFQVLTAALSGRPPARRLAAQVLPRLLECLPEALEAAVRAYLALAAELERLAAEGAAADPFRAATLEAVRASVPTLAAVAAAKAGQSSEVVLQVARHVLRTAGPRAGKNL